MEQIVRTPKADRRRHSPVAPPAGNNQPHLGEKAKLRRATISTLESGEPGTELRTLCDVMAALGLEFSIRPRTASAPNEIEDIF